jgi:hypothetical protein
MKKEDSKDKQNPERKSENRFEAISFRQISPLVPQLTGFRALKYPSVDDKLSSQFANGFFHPPQA